MKKNKRLKLITPTDKTGWLFVLPFVIGFIFLFGKPMLESLNYTFHRVTVGENGLILDPIGWENYNYLFTKDVWFVKELLTMCGNMFVKILVIMFISMFLAILLNDKFPGRLLFRTVLFLPVIFASDLVMQTFDRFGGMEDMSASSNAFVSMGQEATGFVKEIISSFGPLTPYIEKFTGYAGQLFYLMWSCGIQIILFIIGLQTIPKYLYEVAEMEGATKWETFWKITFPLLTPSIILCLTFTIIEYFNSSTNSFVITIKKNMIARLDYACTQSWVYALGIFVVVIIVNAVLSRRVIKMD